MPPRPLGAHTGYWGEVDAGDFVLLFYLAHPVGSHLAEAQIWRNVSTGRVFGGGTAAHA